MLLEELSDDDETKNWLFCELIGSLMWWGVYTRSDGFIAVRAVPRYCSAPKAIQWNAALGILAYMNGTSGFGISFQRGTSAGTLVVQPVGGMCLAEQLCVEVHVYSCFPGRRNMSHFQRLKQSKLPLGIL